jgi:hypothetical protein
MPGMNLKTELTVDETEIPVNGFQIIPVVVHYQAADWKVDHYLVGASIVAGPDHKAVPMRGPRGMGRSAKSAKSSPPLKKRNR